MDKRLAWIAGIGLAILIIVKTPLVFTLFAFFILGMVPGTTLVIPAWVLLILNPLLCAAIVWVVHSHHLLAPLAPEPVVVKPVKRPRKNSAKKKPAGVVAKRRSSRATV